MIKSAEKFSSIANAVNSNFYTLFMHFYHSANFKMIVVKDS